MSKRQSIYSSSKSSWCSNPQYIEAVNSIHDSFYSAVLERKMANRGSAAAKAMKENWLYCFTSCGSRHSGKLWDLKFASCLELLHNAPFSVGGEKVANNTAQIMSTNFQFITRLCPNVSISTLQAKASSGSGSNDVTAALPGTGTTTCISTTEIYQIMIFNFNRTYAPVKNQPTKQQLFPSDRNPTPIFDQLQTMYAMHVTGEVTVWATQVEFGRLTNTQSPLKPLLLYNQNVTLVRIMVETPQLGSFVSKILPSALVRRLTEPKKCAYYLDKIEAALLSWKVTACPHISRAQMKPQMKGEISPYVVHVIDHNYQGWAGNKKNGRLISTDILETCSL